MYTCVTLSHHLTSESVSVILIRLCLSALMCGGLEFIVINSLNC